MEIKHYLYIVIIAVFSISCSTNKKIPHNETTISVEGKWGITSHGSASNMHMIFRIEFLNNGMGSCFHYRDSTRKILFKYKFDSSSSKLLLDYDSSDAAVHRVNGILENYKILSCKINRKRFGKTKFFALELLTEDNKKFILIRPTSYPKYWEEKF